MTRILFVDDEQRLLEGLQRMLRPMRKEWDMRFACSGQEALAALAEKPADVVVSDMRMPGMDGAELLARVSELYPSATRIVLSGQFDVEAGMRLVSVAHQLLAKPCNPSELRAAIQNFANSPNEAISDVTRRVTGSIGSLPSPPRVCLQLLEAVRNQTVSIESVAAIIEHDTALAAKILQLVNSAFFGLPHRVCDIRAAVADLGLDLLRQLVISAEIANSFRPKEAIAGFCLDGLTSHSNLTAAIAGSLAKDEKELPLAVMAGLLHDTGKLVMAARLPREFGQVLDMAAKQGKTVTDCEREVFGCTHSEIGAHLLKLWGLPEPIVEAVAGHHNPSAVPLPDRRLPLPVLVYIADGFAHEYEQRGDLESSAVAPMPIHIGPPSALIYTAAEFAAWRRMAASAARSVTNITKCPSVRSGGICAADSHAF